ANVRQVAPTVNSQEYPSHSSFQKRSFVARMTASKHAKGRGHKNPGKTHYISQSIALKIVFFHALK
ncbi:MAG: hypothetical protein KDD28_31805, partial [Phaeodactylibacter sp.]|nr:hypothetical protein [Phaeodactylibacter sp.]